MSRIKPVVSSHAESGRSCCPQPALLGSHLVYMGRKITRAATEAGGASTGRGPAPARGPPPSPSEHIFSIKYLTSLKVINIYHGL